MILSIMADTFTYTCRSCKKVHQGAPSFSFSSPFYYDEHAEGVKQILNDDLCIVEDDFFIRVTLEIPILGLDEPFLWGVWVSQSKENFVYYHDHFGEDMYGRETFGWFANKLPYYKDTRSLKTSVIYQDNQIRPKIHVEETDHELSSDFHNGISEEKAIMIATAVMHPEEKKLFEFGKDNNN